MMLKVEKLNAGYRDVQILYDVDISVNAGDMVTIIGSNGAGKTTLLKAICQLITRYSGGIWFEEADITRLPSYALNKMGLTMVPEARQLFPMMTVKDNIMMGAFCIKDKAKIKERLEWNIEMFPRMGQRMNQLAGTLSGGEQQMCAIARALMSFPRFLMLDEPSLGLAPNIVEQIFENIKEVNKRENLTVLLVEQNAHLALELTDRAYVMEQGRIVMEGESSSLLGSPEIQNSYLGM